MVIIRYVGAVLIGVVVTLIGFPVFVDGAISGKGLAIDLILLALWLMLCGYIESLEKK
jgi:hypothetical protein